MKRIVKITAFLCLVLFSIQNIYSQEELIKSWEGTLNISGMPLRILFHITVNEEGKLSATIDSPDQGAKGIPVTNISFENGNIKMEASSIAGLFEGKVNDDFTRIKGEWKQGGSSIPLALTPQPELNFFSLWTGELKTGAQSLRLNVRFFKVGEDSIGAFLDSPDQNSNDMPASNVYYGEDSVFFEIKVVGGFYTGRYNEDKTKIIGTWTQGAFKAPLILEKTDKVFESKRPQEPKKPYPYTEEEITFENKDAGITLAGTFTYPKEELSFPAVILVSGSGPQNRNEELFGHKPFLVWADYLTRNGIAVLRYDDRGVGKSSGDFGSAIIPDFTSDAIAAVNYLKSRKEINPDKIGIIGHSEGGIVAPMAANKSDDVSFIVLAAGSAVTGKEILLLQAQLIARAEGAPEDKIKRDNELLQKLYDVIDTVEDSLAAYEKLNPIWDDYINSLPQEEKPENIAQVIEQQKKKIMSPWFRNFLKHDPRPDLEKLDIPVLALFGGKDLQIPASQNKDEMERALEKSSSKNYKVIVLPGLNHLFQDSETGALSGYAKIEETVSPKMLEVMANWIKEITH
ncbi:MAG: alpha/beta fold hydrolase [Ignavibacteriaceae bacterium]